MNKEQELIKNGYQSLQSELISFDRTKFDYKSYCCGYSVHFERSGIFCNLACEKCGKGLSGHGVLSRRKENLK